MKWVIATRYNNTYTELKEILLPDLLKRRGLITDAAITSFLYEDTLGDPFTIPDMQQCVDRIMQAKENDERVVIHGDYDVDGVCAASILFLYLTDILGMKHVQVYIPNRHDEGYGLSKSTLDTLLKEKTQLLITVDCGIKDADLVDYAQACGLDVIITDHHTPGERIPAAYAIIHPMYYLHHNLCGAGIALKIVQALDTVANVSASLDFIDLAGLGTVCDVMELIGENRVIVKKALKTLRENKRLGLETLLELCSVDKAQLDTYHIGYIIGPKLNASGRLESAYESLSLLTTHDIQEAREKAHKLFQLNKRRQTETLDAFDKGVKQVQPEHFIHIMYLPGISIGIIGLVAGKLAEKFHTPVIVLTDDAKDGVLAGSCRSTDDFSIVEALASVAPQLISYGGHKKAAGLKLEKSYLNTISKKLEKYAREKLDGSDREKTLLIDMEFGLPSVRELQDIWEISQILEPFGEANPRPVFSSRIRVAAAYTMGENGKHLRMYCADPNSVGGGDIEAVCFNMGDWNIKKGDIVDIAFTVTRNVWNGREKLQLQVNDIHKV